MALTGDHVPGIVQHLWSRYCNGRAEAIRIEARYSSAPELSKGTVNICKLNTGLRFIPQVGGKLRASFSRHAIHQTPVYILWSAGEKNNLRQAR